MTDFLESVNEALTIAILFLAIVIFCGFLAIIQVWINGYNRSIDRDIELTLQMLEEDRKHRS